MMRCRYGVRSHKIDFSEFCKYAHFQAELLINYYFMQVYKDFQSFKDEYNNSEKMILAIAVNVTTIHAVSYKSKRYFFNHKNSCRDNVILEYICWMRNNANHRAGESKKLQLYNLRTRHKEYFEALESSNLPFNIERDDFDIESIKANTLHKNIYDTQYKSKESFKKLFVAYKKEKGFYEWRFVENFDEMIITLTDFFKQLMGKLITIDKF